MNTRLILKSPRIIGPLLVFALFAGCDRSQSNASGTAAPASASTDPTTGVDMYAADPPPLAQSEVIVESPGPDYVWVAGYWAWRPGDTPHTWVKGHWERPPHPHATWVQPRWERHGKGYLFIRGSWH